MKEVVKQAYKEISDLIPDTEIRSTYRLWIARHYHASYGEFNGAPKLRISGIWADARQVIPVRNVSAINNQLHVKNLLYIMRHVRASHSIFHMDITSEGNLMIYVEELMLDIPDLDTLRALQALKLL